MFLKNKNTLICFYCYAFLLCPASQIVDVCQHESVDEDVSTDVFYVTSPGYPARYPGNRRCSVDVTLPETPITIHVIDVEIDPEQGAARCFDYMNIRDTSPGSLDPERRFCGLPYEEIATEKELGFTEFTIAFQSDSVEHYRGFLIKAGGTTMYTYLQSLYLIWNIWIWWWYG